MLLCWFLVICNVFLDLFNKFGLQGKYVPNRPHLRLISLTDGEEISNDALSVRGFQEYRCNDYHLGTLFSLCTWINFIKYRHLQGCN